MDRRGRQLLDELGRRAEPARRLAERFRDQDEQNFRVNFLYPSLEPLREMGVLRPFAEEGRRGTFGGYALTDMGARLVRALGRYSDQPNFPLSGLSQVWLEMEGLGVGAPATAAELLRLIVDLPPELWVGERELSLEVFPWVVQAQLPGAWTDPVEAYAQLKALQAAHPGLVELRSGQELDDLPNLFLSDPEALRGWLVDHGRTSFIPQGPVHPQIFGEESTSTEAHDPAMDEALVAQESEGEGPQIDPTRARAWLGLVLTMAAEGHRSVAGIALAPPPFQRALEELDQLLRRCPPNRLPIWRLHSNHPLDGSDFVLETEGRKMLTQKESIDARPRGELRASPLRSVERWLEGLPQGLGTEELRPWTDFLARWGSSEEDASQLLVELRLLRHALSCTPGQPDQCRGRATLELTTWLTSPDPFTELSQQVLDCTHRLLIQSWEQDIGSREWMMELALRGLGVALEQPARPQEAAREMMDALCLESKVGETKQWAVEISLEVAPGAEVRAEEWWKQAKDRILTFDPNSRYKVVRKWESNVSSASSDLIFSASSDLIRLARVERSGPPTSSVQVEMELREWLRDRTLGTKLWRAGGLLLTARQDWKLRVLNEGEAPAWDPEAVRALLPTLIGTPTPAQSGADTPAMSVFEGAARHLAHLEALQSFTDNFWGDRLSQLWNTMEGVYTDTRGSSEERVREKLLSALVMQAWMSERWSGAALALLRLSLVAAERSGAAGKDLHELLQLLSPDTLKQLEAQARLPDKARRASIGRASVGLSSMEDLGQSLVRQREHWVALCDEVSDPAHLVFVSALRSLLQAMVDKRAADQLAGEVLRPAWLDAVAMVQRHYALRNRVAHDGYGHDLADQPALRRLTCSLLPLYQKGLLHLAAVPEAEGDPWELSLNLVRVFAQTRPSPCRKGERPGLELNELRVGKLFRADALRLSPAQGRSQTLSTQVSVGPQSSSVPHPSGPQT
jgi:hypothetical protein